MKKEELNIDYGLDVVEEFVPINYELWAVIDSGEGYSCERVWGFVKNIESPYIEKRGLDWNYKKEIERIVCWKPAIMEYNQITILDLEDYELFRHKPTIDEIEKVFTCKSDVGMRNEENHFWIDKRG